VRHHNADAASAIGALDGSRHGLTLRFVRRQHGSGEGGDIGR